MFDFFLSSISFHQNGKDNKCVEHFTMSLLGSLPGSLNFVIWRPCFPTCLQTSECGPLLQHVFDLLLIHVHIHVNVYDYTLYLLLTFHSDVLKTVHHFIANCPSCCLHVHVCDLCNSNWHYKNIWNVVIIAHFHMFQC